MTNKYELLSEERKETILSGLNPDWLTTPGYQLLKYSYLTEECPNLKTTFERIARTAVKHIPDTSKDWCQVFYDLMWSGDLALSTPVLANMGANKGMVVSCTGNYVPDTVYGFYESTKNSAVLSQEGFGTSSYLGDIRPRGSTISRGGTASGVLPVIKQFVQMSRDISQGGTRRGAWAGYLEITHDDFYEIVNYLEHNPEDLNIGWLIPDKFITALSEGDMEANKRYSRALKVKLVTGKGYFFFIDRVNRLAPKAMKDAGLSIKASNLCSEIALPSNEDMDFTCVLSSMNLARRYLWSKDAVFNSTVFLDCVASEFIQEGCKIPGLENAVSFTRDTRSLGLGVLGFHTALQRQRIPFNSIEAIYFNGDVFKELDEESLRASKWLAKELGEPKYLKGKGLRNMTRMAVAPNTSSALVAGSVSNGIEPMFANAFVQPISGGEVNRVNPELIKIMQEMDVYNNATILDILANDGSVQHVSWLDSHEKKVFLTAFEIDQMAVIRLASARQKRIDQGQSLNLFFPANASEEYISKVHKAAFTDKYIKGLYYIRSSNNNKSSAGSVACDVCAS